MRAGGCTVQQTLTTEAASVLKHSLSLARRRGHAQVTPLHVAATLLMSSSRANLLRRACLKSQHHVAVGGGGSGNSNYSHFAAASPLLQCRALELCFNVALNRLPTNPGGAAGPLLHGQPCLSNALIAALKRAQAHQRRGCIENHHNQQHQQQQQPVLAIKVELEQLILSILDDPSVSRVMREAGFSSTAVKNNLEEDSSPPTPLNNLMINTSNSSPNQYYLPPSVYFGNNNCGGVYTCPSSPNYSPPPPPPRPDSQNQKYFWQKTHHFLDCFNNNHEEQKPNINHDVSLKEVMEVLLGKTSKKRGSYCNAVIVGDSVNVTEGLVVELMGRVERGEVPEELRSAHFIKFQFSSIPLKFMKREEVEMNLSDLKNKVDSLISSSSSSGGVIIYAGDLKWTVDDQDHHHYPRDHDQEGYNPVDHLVMEIGRLVSNYSSSNSDDDDESKVMKKKRIWLVGSANYQTYMRCQMKKPSLEVQWALQPVSVPSAGGLGLSLNAPTTCDMQDSRINMSNKNTCELFDRKQCPSNKEEGERLTCCAECSSNYEKELSSAMSQIKPLDNKPSSTILPFWLLHSTTASQTLDKEDLRRKWNRLCRSLHQGRHPHNTECFVFGRKEVSYNTSSNPLWRNPLKTVIDHASFPRFRRQQSCSRINDEFMGNNSSGLTSLDSLKRKVEEDGKDELKITLALGNYSSGLTSSDPEKGMMKPSSSRAKSEEDLCKFLQENVPWQAERIPSIVAELMTVDDAANSSSERVDTWLLIGGNDSIGKQRLALAIAEAAFGSHEMLLTLNLGEKYSEKLKTALREHENLVVLAEDVDSHSVKLLNDGFENGTFSQNSHGRAIFLLTKGSDRSVGKRNPNSFAIQMELQVGVPKQASIPGESDQKKRGSTDWDIPSKINKFPRIEQENNGSSKLSRQSSSKSPLDLNIRASNEESGEDDNGESSQLGFSPNSSDLTLETDQDGSGNPLGFLHERVKRRFVFDRSPAGDKLARGVFLGKMKGAFEEVFGSETTSRLDVEEGVLEGVLVGCGCYLNSLFEKWLKDVFQTSLETVKNGGKVGRVVGIRLCLVEQKEGGIQLQEEVGFMGSNLPKNIKLCF